MKPYYLPLEHGPWLQDTALLSPASRGIWLDLLLHIQHNQSGLITGTTEELARAGRCSLVDLERCLEDLTRHNIADVTFRHNAVTVKNRRLWREAKQRQDAVIRQRRRRDGLKIPSSEDECHAPVTTHSHNHSQNQKQRASNGKLTNAESPPPADTETVQTIRDALAGYMPDWGTPDETICSHIAARVDGRMRQYLALLRRKHRSGARPEHSWAWFLALAGEVQNLPPEEPAEPRVVIEYGTPEDTKTLLEQLERDGRILSAPVRHSDE